MSTTDERRVDLDDPAFTAAVIVGAEARPANRSLGAVGSIHDDATAEQLGFRGGTVAGNVHLDHFGPLVVERFGREWFERGVLSMYFHTPTTHREPVLAIVERGGGDTARAWVTTPTGDVVASGDAGVGPCRTTLDERDRRPVTDVAALELIADLPVGRRLDAGTTAMSIDRQRELLARDDLMTAPIEWYADASPWGPPLACPSVLVDMLWAPFERRLRGLVGPAVGMYGAIEIRHVAGPVLAGVDYELSGVIETVSRSPRSEIFWARTTAAGDHGTVAELVMMIRLLPT